MSFLDDLDMFGEGVAAPLAIDPRSRFIAAAQKQINLIEAGATKKTLWFDIVSNESTPGELFLVTLRNGVAVISLRDLPKRAFKSGAAAIAYLRAAAKAAEAGELDDALAQTQLKRTAP